MAEHEPRRPIKVTHKDFTEEFPLHQFNENVSDRPLLPVIDEKFEDPRKSLLRESFRHFIYEAHPDLLPEQSDNLLEKLMQ
jgi:hypothetical protein